MDTSDGVSQMQKSTFAPVPKSLYLDAEPKREILEDSRGSIYSK